jgi:branched-chain amino acid transport system permease protein
VTFWVIQAFNGISLAMLLFLLAAGLSLIFGLMGIVNLAHGSFYVLGAYVAVSVAGATGSFLFGLAAATAAVAALGSGLHRGLLHRFQGRELAQVLITFGVLFIVSDVSVWIWGGDPRTLPKPPLLGGSFRVGSLTFPTYRLLVITVGLAVAVALWLFQERTPFGAAVRAGVDDEEMARGVGINTPRLFTAVFAAGAFLAALGGVIGGPFLGVYPGADFEVLLLALVVVIIGGLGSLPGAFVASLLVGLLDNLGKALFPDFALFTIFAPMAVILAVRPTGLFGRA